MKLVVQPLAEFNMIAVSDKTYFVNKGAYHTRVLPAACPHRQGPLHLGRLQPDGETIVCPWHENKYSACNIEKKALPSVRTGDVLHVVTAAEATIRQWREYLPLEDGGSRHEA